MDRFNTYLDHDPVDGLAGVSLGAKHGEYGRVLSGLCYQPEYSTMDIHKM